MELPPPLAERPRSVQILFAVVTPVVFGAVCGILLGASEALYLIASVLAILGGYFAGLDHVGAKSGALRGVLGGLLFGSFILIAHELSGTDPKADLPHPGILLVVFTVVAGAILGALGGATRARVDPQP